MKNKKFEYHNKQYLYSALLGASLAFMFCVFAPLDTFFANREEFWFSLAQLLPVLAITFVVGTVIFSVFMWFVRRRKGFLYIYGFFQQLYVFFYIQGNFIPRDYGVLNGTEIKWSEYNLYGYISIMLACTCILSWIYITHKVKEGVYSIGKRLCQFIILIQIVTIGAVWIQDRIMGNGHAEERYVVTNKGMLNLSKDNNIIVFLLDTFDAQDMLDLLHDNTGEEYRELFGRGFTFYPDTLGAYPTTKAAVPYILTGAWYYNDRPFAEYIQDAYRNSPMLESLRKHNYSVGLYTEDRLLNEDVEMYINVNEGAYYIKDYPLFATKIFQLVAFNYMPHQLKRFFNLDTGEFEEFKETSADGGAYSYEVQTNYAYLLDRGISVTESGNCFRFYHTAGVHPYYTFGKDLVTEAGITYDVLDEAEGNCTYLKTFFDDMKKQGIYDNSTIIIMSDHGHYGYSQNPLFMIKNAGETGEFVISKEKMSFAYLSDIFVTLIKGDKVTEEYIQRHGEGGRSFLHYTWDNSWERDYLPRMQEFCVDGYAGDVSSLRMTGREYIGRDNYTYFGEVVSKYEPGDIIDTIYFYSDKYNADEYIVKGVSGQEEWGSWTEGDEVILSIPLDSTDAPFIGMNLNISRTFHQPQSVTVFVNGMFVCEDTIVGNQNLQFAFKKPRSTMVELTLLLPDSIAPSEISESEDHRDLGLGLLTMDVMEAEYETYAIPDDGIIQFNIEDYNANSYVISGISVPEKEGAWTVGNRLMAYMALNEHMTTKRIHVSLDLEDVANGQQKILVEVNGTETYVGTVSKGEISFDIPRPENGKIFMVVNMPDVDQTLKAGILDNVGSFGLMIKRIRIVDLSDEE